MAGALKDQYGYDVIYWLAQSIAAVYPEFDTQGYINASRVGFNELELMPRGQHLARHLNDFLPADYPAAVNILVRSMGEKLSDSRSFSISAFYYLPHSFFIADYGLDYFDVSMAAQYELTQRFTAEFCIRGFLLAYPEQTLKRLESWLTDPSEHVRRLISEGTRPRLPWAIALKPFKHNPAAILPLLEALKDDESLYVRRSVANNLNDIGKDNLDIMCAICERWLVNAGKERRWLVNHALRSAVKRAEPKALAVLGYNTDGHIDIGQICITPLNAVMGDELSIRFELTNKATEPRALLVDLVIDYVKANGRTRAKVFKLKTLQLKPEETVTLAKKIALKPMTTRQHYSGPHGVRLLINGVSFDLAQFDLQVTMP